MRHLAAILSDLGGMLEQLEGKLLPKGVKQLKTFDFQGFHPSEGGGGSIEGGLPGKRVRGLSKI